MTTAHGQTPVLQGEGSRGVRVLEAEITPDPPVPAPKPPPAPPRPTVVIKFCDRPFSAPDLTLTATAGFDAQLGAALRTGRRVVVNLTTPYPDRAPAPAPIGRWLSEVKAGGGSVTTKQYCDAARGSLGAWLAEIFAPKGRTQALYRPARSYNVILHADALDKVVTQVEFAPKAGG